MNDKAATTEAAFDPAAQGWERVKAHNFGELIGPVWRKGDGLLPTSADNGKGLATDAYARQLAKADALIDGVIRDNLGGGSR